MWPFRRTPKPTCPQCGLQDHVKPDVHNTRIRQAAEAIAKARAELAIMEPDEDNRDRIGHLNNLITAQFNWAEEQRQYADDDYQDIDHFIDLEMRNT